MTNSNRRQLARVRNAFLGATALAGFAAALTPASAIVINNNFTPAQVVDTTNITGVGQMVVDEQNGFIGLCTVSLINPRTVIFASHCVNENPAETAFMSGTGYGAANGGLPIGFGFQANNNAAGNSAIGHWLNGNAGGPKDQTSVADAFYNSNFVVYNTNCCTIGLGNNFLQSDVAMAALDTPAVGIPTWTLLFSALTAPAHATIEGYGDNGTGTTGQGTIDFKRRVAENIVSLLGSLDDQDTFLFGAPDGLPANLYMVDFNDPKFGTAQANQFDFNIFHDTATTKEGITAPGDSGGPLVIDHEFAAPTIAAVLSGGDRFYNAQPGSSYGTTSFYQPLYLYWDWILANNPYKYVGAKAGNGSWTDVTHWQMNLDPAYLTVDGSGNLINALPTTPAAGETNIAPGFGEVCYFNDCINIKTGVETNPTPPPGPNPTSGTAPFGGILGQAGFEALVQSYIASTAASSCAGGPALVSVASLDSGVADDVSSSACPAVDASPSPQSNWINPEGTALVNGVAIQGAPGASPGQAPNDQNANVATLAPARYYDVTLAAAGTTTLSAGLITIDRLTINGATTGLTIAAPANLTVLIDTTVFAGNTEVDGTLVSAIDVNMFGGVLSGTGNIFSPNVNFLISAVAPGTVGTVGTLTINGNANLGVGSTTVIDITNTTSDLLKVNGTATVGGTLMINPLSAPHMSDSHVVLAATAITGAYNLVPDTIAGVLFPVVNQVTAGTVKEEVVTFQAQSFFTQLSGGTADQTTIENALDAGRAAHYGDLKALYDDIDPLTGAALGQALENLAPDAERAAPLVGDMETTGFDNLLWQQLASTGGAPGGSQQAGLRVDGEGLKMAMASATGSSIQTQELVGVGMGIATNPGGGNIPLSTGAAASPSDADATWMDLPNGAGGFLAGSSLDGSVVIGGGGGKADVRGLVVGAGLDMPVGDGFTVGASFGYSDASAVLRATPASLQTDTLQGALYARYDFGTNFIAEAFASYGHQTITTRRTAFVGAGGFGLTGHTGGDTPSLGAYIGRSFGITTGDGSTLTFVPSLSVQYIGSSIDAFTETGGVAAMSFAGYSEDAAMSRLGFDAKETFDVFGIGVTPNVHLFWVDNFEGTNGTISSVFAAGPSAVMTFALAPRDRSYGEMGLGADFDLGTVMGEEATLSARYDGNTRQDISYGAWTGRLSIKF